MTEASDDLRGPVLAAVQAALTEFGLQVKTEIDALRAAVASEKAARVAAEAQVAELAADLELNRQQAATHLDEVRQLVTSTVDAARSDLDGRLEASDAVVQKLRRQTADSEGAIRTARERVEALESWSDASTDASNELEQRLGATETRAAALADEVAAERSALSSVTGAIDAVAASAASALAAQTAFGERLDAADVRRQTDLEAATASLAESVDAQIVAAETRVAEQLAETQQQVAEELRTRIAVVDEEFDRVATGVESSVTALNARSNDLDERLGGLIERVTAIEAVVSEIDVDIIDDLSERVSTAAGEAVLIRIETERFQESVKETNDKMILRITEVEAQLQAQEMDVESAVQLERLEEIERALIELDPAQFVRVDDVASGSTAHSGPAEVPFVGSTGETGDQVARRADEPNPPKPTLPSSTG